MNNTEKVLEKLSGTIEDRGELSSVSDYETLEAAILKYGAESQIDIAIEEMSELTKALLKERRQAKKGFDVSAENFLIWELGYWCRKNMLEVIGNIHDNPGLLEGSNE